MGKKYTEKPSRKRAEGSSVQSHSDSLKKKIRMTVWLKPPADIWLRYMNAKTNQNICFIIDECISFARSHQDFGVPVKLTNREKDLKEIDEARRKRIALYRDKLLKESPALTMTKTTLKRLPKE